MSGSASASGAGQEDDRRADRQEDLVWWATWLGLVLAVVGLIDGVVMALDKEEAPCPDGQYFPEGTTDFDCYVQPNLELGVAVAALSVVLGILVMFGSILVRASLRTPSESPTR